MDYVNQWNDVRNAAGFALECARLAFPSYEGAQWSTLVQAIKAAESCLRGERVNPEALDGVARAVARVGQAAVTTRSCAAVGAVRIAIDGARPGAVADCMTVGAASYALDAGVPQLTLRRAFTRWVVRDLGLELYDQAEIDDAIIALTVRETRALTPEPL